MAEKLEEMIKNQKISLSTLIDSKTPYGLRISGTMEQNSPEKPIIFTIKYIMDPLAFKEWLKNNSHLTEGPLAFIGRGISITVPWGPEKYDKSGFCFSADDGSDIWVHLLKEPGATFRVHRDVFSGKEWECFHE